jgi:hypothetical protein
MNNKPLTPHLFSKLKTYEEKDKAYADLWVAWQDKGMRKSAINDELNQIHEGRRRGNRLSNKADLIVAEKIIEHYWTLQQASEPVTAEILFIKQHETFQPNHFVIGTVTRWNTSLRKIWFSQQWGNHDGEFQRFKNLVWEKHRSNISPQQR